MGDFKVSQLDVNTPFLSADKGTLGNVDIVTARVSNISIEESREPSESSPVYNLRELGEVPLVPLGTKYEWNGNTYRYCYGIAPTGGLQFEAGNLSGTKLMQPSSSSNFTTFVNGTVAGAGASPGNTITVTNGVNVEFEENQYVNYLISSAGQTFTILAHDASVAPLPSTVSFTVSPGVDPAIVAGNGSMLIPGGANSTENGYPLVITDANATVNTFTVTGTSSLAVTEDQYKNALLYVDNGDAAQNTYVVSNSQATAGGAITVTTSGAFANTLVGTRVTLVPSIYNIAPYSSTAGGTQTPIGINVVDHLAGGGRYMWVQTGGPTSVKVVGNLGAGAVNQLVPGKKVVPGSTGTGRVMRPDPTSDEEILLPEIGTCILAPIGVDQMGLVNLKL